MQRQLAQPAAERASRHLWWRTQQKAVRRLSDEGVSLLAGTDTACEGGLPGYSLHGELEELVAAGLSPAQALRTATIEPARYLGRNDEGEVLTGHRANLVILHANPLVDIRNTRRITAVMLKGKLVAGESVKPPGVAANRLAASVRSQPIPAARPVESAFDPIAYIGRFIW